MNVLRYFASAFINFFGITQSTRDEENRAAVFIAFLFASVLVMLGVILHALLHFFHD